MTGRATWRRVLGGVLIALVIALFGASPSAMACPDDMPPGVEASGALSRVAACDDGSGGGCADACVACPCCQSHHAGGALPAAAISVMRLSDLPDAHRFALADPFRSHVSFRLDRPPRG